MWFCDFRRIPHTRHTLTRWSCDPFPILRISGSVAGAIPGAVCRVPGQGTAQMAAGGTKTFVHGFLFIVRGERFLQSQMEDGVAQVSKEGPRSRQ